MPSLRFPLIPAFALQARSTEPGIRNLNLPEKNTYRSQRMCKCWGGSSVSPMMSRYIRNPGSGGEWKVGALSMPCSPCSPCSVAGTTPLLLATTHLPTYRKPKRHCRSNWQINN
ncbi:hypothetical protein F4801DRAFT_495468 [Xylaria longipes]|nr:hypothetical protein F4801DRAFT_495468 [Xylaria longipes]